MLPFGETVLAWRLARGLTQAQLATAALVPRPNLSAIERGEREVTLKTLRALAVALDVRPGVLVDGEAPSSGARPLSRAALERIAAAAVHGRKLADPREAALARGLREAMSSRMPLVRPRRARRHLSRTGDRAYFFLRTAEPSEVIASLVDRTTGHLASR